MQYGGLLLFSQNGCYLHSVCFECIMYMSWSKAHVLRGVFAVRHDASVICNAFSSPAAVLLHGTSEAVLIREVPLFQKLNQSKLLGLSLLLSTSEIKTPV